MRNSGGRNAVPIPQFGAPTWNRLKSKRSTELSVGCDGVLTIETKKLVEINRGQGAKSMALIKCIKGFKNGDDLLWLQWCYSEDEVEEGKWPKNATFTHLLSSHQGIHKADTVCGTVEDTKVVSHNQVYVFNRTSGDVKDAGSCKWLKKLLDEIKTG